MDHIYDRPDPKTVNINHVFRVENESAHIGYFQYFHGEAESEYNYNNDNAYINVQRDIINKKYFKHSNQLEKPKVRVENRLMISKFRRFCCS